MTDLLAAVCLVLGGAFAFLAGLGLVRLRDLPSRMHAATKAAGAAFALVLVAVCLRNPGWEVAAKSALALLFAFLTLPVAAHLLGRSVIPSRPPSPGPDLHRSHTPPRHRVPKRSDRDPPRGME